MPLDESLGGKEEENPTQDKNVTHKVSDLDKRILAAIEEKPSLTQTELAMQLGVNLNTVKYRIKNTNLYAANRDVYAAPLFNLL